MSHINKFNDFYDKKYKKGDYVLLYKTNNSKWHLPYGRISKVGEESNIVKGELRYYIEIFVPNERNLIVRASKGGTFYTWVLDFQIIKKLSKEEVDIMNIEIDAIKYNI